MGFNRQQYNNYNSFFGHQFLGQAKPIWLVLASFRFQIAIKIYKLTYRSAASVEAHLALNNQPVKSLLSSYLLVSIGAIYL